MSPKVTVARFRQLLKWCHGDHAVALKRLFTGGPAITGVIGVRSTSSSRTYVCNGCGRGIDSESARYGKTVHAQNAIDAHLKLCSAWAPWELMSADLRRILGGRVEDASDESLAVALDQIMEGR